MLFFKHSALPGFEHPTVDLPASCTMAPRATIPSGKTLWSKGVGAEDGVLQARRKEAHAVSTGPAGAGAVTLPEARKHHGLKCTTPPSWGFPWG